MSSEPIQIVEYDPSWPEQFERLAARARTALGPLAIRVEHVGSTAVPGLTAKPIIDLDLVVLQGDRSAAISALTVLGYLHEGDLGIVGRDAFRWPAGDTRHHLYVVADDSAELIRHVAFRDALRADAELCARYAELKRVLARQFGNDRDAYSAGKDGFISDVLKSARDIEKAHAYWQDHNARTG